MAEYGPVGLKVMAGARRANVPLYVHFHGWDASRLLLNPKIVHRYQKLFRSGAGFFAPSRFLANRLIEVGCPPGKIWVTPCGIDPVSFPKSKREANRYLAVGRLVEKKAPLNTLAAFAKALEKRPNLHLDMVGGGKLRSECEAFIRLKGLGSNITLHGEKQHDFVRQLMQQSSVFLQHSVTAENGDTEGLPVAILEAMCAGLAVVSTKHSGIPEAVVHEETGFLVDEHDVEGMSNAIIRLSDDTTLCMNFGDAGRERASSHFDINEIVNTLRNKMRLAENGVLPNESC